jgi:hypothetical protein
MSKMYKFLKIKKVLIYTFKTMFGNVTIADIDSFTMVPYLAKSFGSSLILGNTDKYTTNSSPIRTQSNEGLGREGRNSLPVVFDE